MTGRSKIAIAVLSLALVCGVSLLLAAQPVFKKPPLVLPVDDLKIQIVGATFVDELQGVMGVRFNESQPEKFRGLVVTLEVHKPAGRELTFVGQDFTLHYNYGDKSDVSRCNGVSTFSTEKDVDRPMQLFRNVGRSSTGIATKKADKVFVDLFFQFMEPETSDIHLCIGQPVGAAYQTKGWE